MVRERVEGGQGYPLWFNPPTIGEVARRVTLTRERVVAEALAVIGRDGVEALSMRGLAARLGVVPGALYRHVRDKEQLYDLILDEVLAEVDCGSDPELAWAGQVAVLATRLRAVLEDHPGSAGLLKLRDPLTPNSLALTEAFLGRLRASGLSDRQTVLAYHLIYDYTLGFALGDHTSVREQRVRDSVSRSELHQFLRSLPVDRFPALVAVGEQLWVDDRDDRFAANLDTLLGGLQAVPSRAAPRARPRSGSARAERRGRSSGGNAAGRRARP